MYDPLPCDEYESDPKNEDGRSNLINKQHEFGIEFEVLLLAMYRQ